MEFPEKVMRQVENVANEVSAADMAGRMDLRDWQTVTIDGEDAKDFSGDFSFRLEIAKTLIVNLFTFNWDEADNTIVLTAK